MREGRPLVALSSDASSDAPCGVAQWRHASVPCEGLVAQQCESGAVRQKGCVVATAHQEQRHQYEVGGIYDRAPA